MYIHISVSIPSINHHPIIIQLLEERSNMFTTRELNLINKRYFKVIRYVSEKNYIEIQSRCSKDYWIIQKGDPAYYGYPIILYHKHPGQQYYHRHWQCYKVNQTISSIKSHDAYTKLRKWNDK